MLLSDRRHKRVLAIPTEVAEQLEAMQWSGPKYRSLSDVVREVAAIGLDALDAQETADLESAPGQLK